MDVTQKPGMPTPCGSKRDADGRLVGLVFTSVSPPAADAPNAWLVAVDGSEHALHAVAEAARMAGTMTACSLHLVNVQHWLGTEAAETELAQRGWEATAQARALLDKQGLPWQLHILMGDAAKHIVVLAGHLGCSGIVIGSRSQGVTEKLLLGSVAEKVIHTSKLPVLMVP